jgi:alpha-beta hydrolase superfamily lysophospholipase
MEQKLSFRNSRGLNLVGILHAPENPTSKAVIIVHGFTSNKEGSHGKIPKAAERLTTMGLAVLRFDFSGCGESDPDTITVSKQVDDLKSATAFMRGKGYTEIALVGSSLGGLVSILAYDKDIKTMALWAPVTKAKIPSSLQSESARKELEEKGFLIIRNKKGVYKVDKEFMSERTTLNRKKILSRIKCPVLIVHGDTDDILPLQDSKEAIQYLPKGSRLEVIPGANHHFTGKVDEVINLTVEWMKNNL